MTDSDPHINDIRWHCWNTLHDGGIDSFTGNVPGDLDLKIGITYLCDLLPTDVDFIFLRLVGCTFVELHPYKGEPTTELVEIVRPWPDDIQILSAEFDGETVKVWCDKGALLLKYDAAEMRLADGTPISQAELEAVAERYWTAFSNRRTQK